MGSDRDMMLSTGEVARALGVSINTVKRMAARGQVEAVRLPSGHHRIPRVELDRLLTGRSPSPLPERRAAWRRVEAWRAGRPPEVTPLPAVLAWVEEMLAISRPQGPLPDRPVAETVEGVRRLHRALAGAGR